MTPAAGSRDAGPQCPSMCISVVGPQARSLYSCLDSSIAAFTVVLLWSGSPHIYLVEVVALATVASLTPTGTGAGRPPVDGSEYPSTAGAADQMGKSALRHVWDVLEYFIH